MMSLSVLPFKDGVFPPYHTAGKPCFPALPYFGSKNQGLVWEEGASNCRAEFAALLRLGSVLPVPPRGLARRLKLHLAALCSVLIRTGADILSPICPPMLATWDAVSSLISFHAPLLARHPPGLTGRTQNESLLLPVTSSCF